MKNILVVSLFLAASTASLLHAESLEERKYWAGEMDYMNRSIDDAVEKCGVKLSFEFVDKPTLRAETAKTDHTPYGVCAGVVDEVDSICREGDDEKQSVAAKIKGFRCGYAAKRTLTLKNGIVTYMGNNVQSNWSDWARPILLKAL